MITTAYYCTISSMFKSCQWLIKHYLAKKYRVVLVQLHIFLTLTLHKGMSQLHAPAALAPKNELKSQTDRRLSGPDQSGHRTVKRKVTVPIRIKPWSSPYAAATMSNIHDIVRKAEQFWQKWSCCVSLEYWMYCLYL